MRIDCYKCNAVYQIPDEAIGPGGVRAQCPRCGAQETIRPDRTDVGKALGNGARPEAGGDESDERDGGDAGD
ncbi:MAG: zinc-ribbon domain-containing protein, partial [Myxococcota bacterium]